MCCVMRHVKATILFLSNLDGHTVTWVLKFFTLESGLKNLFLWTKDQNTSKIHSISLHVKRCGEGLKYIVVMLEENEKSFQNMFPLWCQKCIAQKSKMTQNKNGTLPNRCKRFRKTRLKVTIAASKMCGMSGNLNTWVSLTV